MSELWGAETPKAIDNFPVSGRPIPPGVVHWLGRIKAAAARVTGGLGLLDGCLAAVIATAGDAVAAGERDAQFPIDVFQTGSGTSSNMNANEVLASLAAERLNDGAAERLNDGAAERLNDGAAERLNDGAAETAGGEAITVHPNDDVNDPLS